MNQILRDTTKAFISQFETDKETGFGEDKRKEAVKMLEQALLPTTKTEAWKYTSLKAITSKRYQSPENHASRNLGICCIPELDAHTILFVNGAFHSVCLSSGNDEALIVKSFGEMSEEESIIAEKYFAEISAKDSGIFTTLNTAYNPEGVFIYVPAGTIIHKPVHIQHLTDSSIDIAFQHRNIIVVGENSSLKVIETYHGAGGKNTLRNQVSEIFVAQNASFTGIKYQNEGDKASHIEQCNIIQKGNSVTDFYTISLSGEIVRNNLNIHINGERAHAGLKGGYLLSGNQHVDNYTEVHHIMPNCTSNELYKGIIGGEATAVFNGKIQVYPDAQKTQAYQSNKSILLTDTANVYTKPQLEIYADDVKCSHGATTGQINEDALFYMQARGISRADARKLLVCAFLEDTFESIVIEEVRKYIHAAIQQKLDIQG